MASTRTDKKTKVTYVAAIASQAAPTAAECNGGTDLEGQLTPDGVIGFEPSTSEIDNSVLASDFTTKEPGRAEFSGTMLRFLKTGNTGDTIYNLFVRDLAGYIVIRRGIDYTTDYAATQAVEVYPIKAGETRNLPPEANGLQKWEVSCTVTSSPSIRATVAA